MKGPLTSVADADRMVMETARDPGVESVPLGDAVGRILRKEIRADRDLPPFNRVAMDGIAIRYAAFDKGQRQFRIKAVQGAGEAPTTLEDSSECVEIMTGAMLGKGADTIIRYEDLKMNNGEAIVVTDHISEGQNIHRQGADSKKGALLINPGVKISTPEIAIAASVGLARITVTKYPEILILSSGDELVRIQDTPEPYQIRSSNAESLQAALKQYGFPAVTDHMADDREQVRAKLATALEEKDVLILSGGVSKGKYDHVADVLGHLGVNMLFHGVAQRPGKPFWFGIHEKQETIVFALPGNPVSSFVCFYRYVLPWMRASSQEVVTAQMVAALKEDIAFKPELTYFVPVRIGTGEKGVLEAIPVAGQGSGDFVQLAKADGFLELPAKAVQFYRDEAFPFIPVRNHM